MESTPAPERVVVGEKATHRLTQRPASYEVLRYIRAVVWCCRPLPTTSAPEQLRGHFRRVRYASPGFPSSVLARKGPPPSRTAGIASAPCLSACRTQIRQLWSGKSYNALSTRGTHCPPGKAGRPGDLDDAQPARRRVAQTPVLPPGCGRLENAVARIAMGGEFPPHQLARLLVETQHDAYAESPDHCAMEGPALPHQTMLLVLGDVLRLTRTGKDHVAEGHFPGSGGRAVRARTPASAAREPDPGRVPSSGRRETSSGKSTTMPRATSAMSCVGSTRGSAARKSPTSTMSA